MITERMTADEFRARRAALGLSLSEIAKILEVDRRSVSRYQSGERKVPKWAVRELNRLN